MKPHHLSTGDERHLVRLGVYSLPAIPLAIMIVPATALVPIFYTGEFGMDLATVGYVLLGARIFDAVTDPLIGYLSDNSKSRMGKRRPWLLIGVPVLLLGIWVLFAPFIQPDATYLMIASCLTYLGWTLIQIPYWSWGAEIGRSYNDRSTVSGFRESAMILGIAAASLAPLVGAAFGHGIDQVTMMALAILVTVSLPVCIAAACLSFKENPSDSVTASSLGTFISVFKLNAPFRRLVSAFSIIEFGKGASVAVMPYLLTHYFQRPELIGLVLLVPYVLIVVSTPIWLRISQKIGKHRAIALSLFISALLLSVAVAPLNQGHGIVFFGIECLVGLAAGGFAVLPYAIVADTADYYAEKSCGDTKIATHFAAWSFARKVVMALSVGVALPVLAAMGFDPNAETVTNAGATKWTFIALAVPFYLAGVLLLLRFPLTQEVHERIIQKLQEKHLNTEREA